MMLFVTAADNTHQKSLIRLLGMITTHHPEAKIMAWDMGLDAEYREEAERWATVREFPFKKLPDWMNIKINYGEYAWKPVCLEKSLRDVSGVVVWADAGCRVLAPLTDEMQIAKRHRVYASTTAGTLEQYTDPRTLDRMEVPLELRQCSMRAATLVVFADFSFIRRWADCAMDKNIIAPNGSRKHPLKKRDKTPSQNHRQDQSCLTALIANAGLADKLPVKRFNWTRGPDIK